MATVKKVIKAQRGGCVSNMTGAQRQRYFQGGPSPLQKAGQAIKDVFSGGKTKAERQEARAERKAARAAKKSAPAAKHGKSIKKAQDGAKTKVALRSGQLRRLGRLSAKNPDKAEKVAGKMVERATRRQRGKEYLKKNAPVFIPEVPTVEGKRGLKVKKARSGATLSPKSSSVSKRLSSYPKTIGKAKGGMSLGKCKYGC